MWEKQIHVRKIVNQVAQLVKCSCSSIMMSRGIIQQSLQLATLTDWGIIFTQIQVYPLDNR